MSRELAHVGEDGRPRMVDVSAKPVTHRRARARCEVVLPQDIATRLREAGFRMRKGPVIDTAIIAATQAVKRTHELIPFCHPLPIEHCELSLVLRDDGIMTIECEVAAHSRTGVEMEALTGATVAALTVYDMCKSLGHGIRIREVRVVSKQGGRHDFVEEDACP